MGFRVGEWVWGFVECEPEGEVGRFVPGRIEVVEVLGSAAARDEGGDADSSASVISGCMKGEGIGAAAMVVV